MQGRTSIVNIPVFPLIHYDIVGKNQYFLYMGIFLLSTGVAVMMWKIRKTIYRICLSTVHAQLGCYRNVLVFDISSL